MTENVSALTLISSKTPLEVFSDNGLDPVLKAIESEVKSFIPDISSKKGRDEIRSFATKIAKSKTALDGLGKDLVSEWKEKSKKVDAERRRAWDFLENLQHEVRKPLTKYEEREEKRLQNHENALAQIEAYKTVSSDSTSEYIQNSKLALEAIQINASWEEFEAKAFRVKNEALDHLNKILESRLKFESDQAELKRLREENEAREKKEREEKIAQEAAQKAREEAEQKAKLEKEKIEKEKAQAIELQKKAEEETRIAKEKAEKDKLESERKAKEASERAEKEKVEAEARAREQERLRIHKEKEAEEEVRKKREADINNRRLVNNEVLVALVRTVGVSEEVGKKIIESIVKGEIPNVRISY